MRTQRDKLFIDTLLERYFEGLTTHDEENCLRAYFVEGKVRKAHRSLAPLFTCVPDLLRSSSLPPLEEAAVRQQRPRTKLLNRIILVASAAAILALAIILPLYNTPGKHDELAAVLAPQKSYIIIGGVHLQSDRAALQLTSDAFDGIVDSEESLIDIIIPNK